MGEVDGIMSDLRNKTTQSDLKETVFVRQGRPFAKRAEDGEKEKNEYKLGKDDIHCNTKTDKDKKIPEKGITSLTTAKLAASESTGIVKTAKRRDIGRINFAGLTLINKLVTSADGQTNTVECQYVDERKEDVSNKRNPDELVQGEGDSKKIDEQRGALKYLDSPSVDVHGSPLVKEVTELALKDDQSADTLNVSKKQKAGESPDSNCIFKDNLPKLENNEFQKSSDILSDPCDFCAENAKFTCKNCDYVYCTSCLEKLHPAIGPYKQHEVTAFDKGLKTEHQRCKEHGLVAKLFCSFCEMTRCVECANNKCCLHFKGKVSDTDIELEKKKLVAALEKATTKLSVDKYKAKVNYELENIQNTALLRTEQIRQEFISFHDLLAQKEEKMLHTLQQDTAHRLKHIKETLEASVNNLEIEETKLTSTVTDLVQCENTARFIEEYVTAGELCSNAYLLVKEFDSHWAKNCEYTHSSLLDYPFTMLLEKMELSKKLDKAAGGEFHVRFKQTTLFLNSQDEMFSITEYLDIATPPPSTIVSYIVQLLRNRQIVVQQEVNDLKDVGMNTFIRNFLCPGARFLLRITPRYQCHTGSNSFTTKRGRPVHMLIVVDHLTGLQCLSCTDAVLPTECDTVRQCGPHENCFTEKYVSDSGIIRFHLGCKVIQMCMLTSIVSSVTHNMLHQTKCEEEVACSVNTIALIGKRRKRRFTEELCNLERNSTSSPAVSPLTSPVPVTVNYPCISNPCARGRCSPDNGTYHCICENGFSGRHCDQFIAETLTSTSVNTVALERCLPNPCVWGKCESIQTTYICICDHGYYGTKCDKDINECDVTTACGVEATCTNFQGGYNCTCHTGFPQGDPKIHCYKPVLVEIETPGSWYQMNDEPLPAANIPYKMPYLNKEFNAYRPSMNGYFLLDAQPLYENYGPQNPHDWQKFSYRKTVIAPLWTDLDATGGQGGLIFNLLEKYTNYGLNDSVNRDLTMLGVLFSTSLNFSDFDPRVAIVATWRNITRWTSFGPKENIKRENISMQAILISDGIQTYLMFNYDQEQWSLKPLSYAPAAAGYSNQDKTGNIIADNHNFTTLNNRSNVGIAGRYIYNVSFDDYNRVSQLINDTKCLKFRQNKTLEQWIKANQALSDPCPCNENQMQLEYTYRVVPALYDHPQVPLTCYEACFFNSDNIRQTCCYRYGTLNKEDGGFATFDPDTYSLLDRFYECCSGDKHLCHLFYEMSPSDDCSRF